MALVIGKSVRDGMVQHARSAYPNECCGILVGHRLGPDYRVARQIPTDNIAAGDRRRTYQVEWKALFETLKGVRRGPEELVGFYHSHPEGPARPSPRDLASAWTDQAYVIVSLVGRAGRRFTSWRVHRGGSAFEREAIVLDEPGGPSVR